MKFSLKSSAVALLLPTICLFLCCSSGEEKSEGKVVSEVVVASSESWDGNTLPHYPTGTPKVTLLRITVPPHTKLDMHKHPIINVGYMVKGELTVVSEAGETLLLKPGDGIVELVEKYHYGENRGDSEVEIIVFYAGDSDSQLTVYK